MLRVLFNFYKKFISPLFPPACRFHPTCSDYCNQAIQIHGLRKGSWLSLKRVCRCHPYAEGGFDPVPLAPKTQPQVSHPNFDKIRS